MKKEVVKKVDKVEITEKGNVSVTNEEWKDNLVAKGDDVLIVGNNDEEMLKALVYEAEKSGYKVLVVGGGLEKEKILELAKSFSDEFLGEGFWEEKLKGENTEGVKKEDKGFGVIVNEKNEGLLKVYQECKDKFGEDSEVFDDIVKIGFRLGEIAKDDKREGYARSVANRAQAKLMEVGKMMGFPSMYKLIREFEKEDEVEYVGRMEAEEIEELSNLEDKNKEEDEDEYRSS